MSIKDELARLAVAETMVKRLKLITDPRAKERNLRQHVEEELVAQYEATGSSTFQVEVEGQKVGTMSLRFTDEKVGKRPVVTDYRAFARWIRESDGGMDTIVRLVNAKPDLMLDAATADGELPDGCEMREFHEPKRVSGATLRVKPEKVADALAGELPQAVAGLLSGDGE